MLYLGTQKPVLNDNLDNQVRPCFFLAFVQKCGLTRSGLELTINRSRGKHVNHHTTDAVLEIFSTTITNLY
jgi:hypothetical protein